MCRRQEPRFRERQFYCWDQLHLTVEGYRRLGQLLRPQLERNGLESGWKEAAEVTLDTSGEPYTLLGMSMWAWLAPRHLLIYAGNAMGLSANATAILLQDSRVTCLTDIYNPCPRSQVLKAEACGSSKQHF